MGAGASAGAKDKGRTDSTGSAQAGRQVKKAKTKNDGDVSGATHFHSTYHAHAHALDPDTARRCTACHARTLTHAQIQRSTLPCFPPPNTHHLLLGRERWCLPLQQHKCPLACVHPICLHGVHCYIDQLFHSFADPHPTHAHTHTPSLPTCQFNIICRVVFDEADRNKNGKLDNGEVRVKLH
jgi:hypothetical protein